MPDFKEFVNIIYGTRDKKLLEDFLIGITTTKERKELSQRVKIIKRLIDGDPQARIASELGVGIATVTRGSKELSDGRFKVLRNK